MADTAGKLVVDVLKKDCKSLTCYYRAGDSGKALNSLTDKLDQKLKHRVADGNEVRALEARVAELEKALKSCLASAIHRKHLAEQDLIKKALYPERKKK